MVLDSSPFGTLIPLMMLADKVEQFLFYESLLLNELVSVDPEVVGTRYFAFVLILDSTIKLSRYYSGYS